VLVDVVAVDVMHAAVVEVVLVTLVLDRLVAAVRSVLVVVVRVNLVVAHVCPPCGAGVVTGWCRRGRSGPVRVVVSVVAVRLGRVLDRAVDEIAHVCVREGVEDVLSGPASRDDAFGAEQAELLRDGGEPDSGGLGQLGDAPLAVAQTVEQLEPGDVSGRAEDRGGALELIIADEAQACATSVLVGATDVSLTGASSGRARRRRAVRVRMRMGRGGRGRGGVHGGRAGVGLRLVRAGDPVGLVRGGARHHFTI